jgi:prepilin-type N-terminal cleavage/methylation domain-containing protein
MGSINMKKKNRTGMTIIELVIVMAVMTMIIAIAYGLMLTGIRSYKSQIANVNNQQNARQSMMIVTKNIRMNDPDDIVIEAGNNKLIIDNGTDTIEYYVNNDSLYENSKIIAYNIKSFTAERDVDNLTVTIETNKGEAIRGYEISTELRLRK